MDGIKGYKVFESDWTCRDFQYEVGKVFEEDVKPKCCDRGFHFCENAADCFKKKGAGDLCAQKRYLCSE